jgi:hypothetical protein
VAALVAEDGIDAYTAAKGGLLALTRSVALRRVRHPGARHEQRRFRRPHRHPLGGVMAARYPADPPARPVPDHDANGSLLDPHQAAAERARRDRDALIAGIGQIGQPAR